MTSLPAMLEGVRVLDLSRLLPGPACTWYLAGLGAVVDRVEPAQGGDWARVVPPMVNGVGAHFAAVSLGKRSLAVRLRRPEGVALIRRLLGSYDVLVEGFRPGVLETMGLDPAALLRDHPRLIVARLTGYGQTGPYRDVPGHDLNFVGLAGHLAAAALVDGVPALPPLQMADFCGALTGAMGIAAALFQRERTGRGRVLDVSLAESALAPAGPQITGYTAQGVAPRSGGDALTGGVSTYGVYACADGEWITVASLEPKFREALVRVVGDLSEAALRRTFATRTRDDWVDVLGQACVAPVLRPGDLAAFPPFAARESVVIRDGATWVRPPLGALPEDASVPGLGEHTDIILREAGLSDDEVAQLRADEVVA